MFLFGSYFLRSRFIFSFSHLEMKFLISVLPLAAAKSLRAKNDRQIASCDDVAALKHMHREERRLETYGVRDSGVLRDLHCEGW